MRHAQLWHSLLLVAATGLLLTTCTGRESKENIGEPEPPPQAQVTERVVEQTPEPVTIRFAISDWQRDAYKDLAAMFMEANPDVCIQFISYDELLGPVDFTQGFDQIKWPDLPRVADVFPINMPMSTDVVATRRVRDLTPFIEADADFHPEDFYPGALEGYQWGNGTWAIPVVLGVNIVMYHKSLFDAAGVTYPEPGWTWEDLIAKAQALTERNGDKVTRWGFAFKVRSPIILIESRAGVPLIDYTSDPPMPRFDRPEVVEAVRWYTGLYAEAVITYPVSIDNPQALYDGKVAAIWTDTLWRLPSPQIDVGIAPFPVDTRGLTPIFPIEALAMSAGTRYPEAAWRWIKFLTYQRISGLLFGSPLPARRSVAENTGYWESLDTETAAVLQYVIQHGHPRPFEASTGGGEQALFTALDAILSGEKSVEDALAEANVEAIELMRKERERLASITPVPPFTVGEGEGRETPEGAVTITFIAGAGSSDRQRYLDLAIRFHETHPDIAVEIAALDSPATLPDLAGLAAAADCFLAPPDFRGPQDVAAVLSLRPFLDAEPSYPADDFFPAALLPFTWQGDLRGLPAELVPYVVEYKRDLFDAAGVDYPRSDWTYDEFVARAIALTQGEGEDILQYGFVPEPFADYVLPLILERWGADLLDETQNPPALSFDSPATVAALRRYTDLATVHRVQPHFAVDLTQPSGAALMEWESLIRSGRAAMWMVSSAWSAYLHQDGAENLGVAPLPAGGGGSGYVQAKGYLISAQSRAPQACWEWINFLSGQPEAVQGLPARRSLAESEVYRQRVSPERTDAYLAAVADADPHSFIVTAAQQPWLHGVEYWLFRAYTQVVNGERSVEAALAEVQGLADAYRACVISRDALYDQEKWEGCLRDVDSTLPPSLFGAE
ncbi:MAG: extracellular solute-binding protein [Anaerolineae bacterium]|nr:extracellular solute-binding protein [Anaerolineae bacterium]